MVLALLGSGVAITVSLGSYETVPYTKRNHFVFLSRDVELNISQKRFDRMNKEMDVLPATQPESMRVRLVAKRIIEALQRDSPQSQGLDWGVIVVNQPILGAYCLPGAKIVVFTGLLKHFKSDADIAAILGHEVAHAVARHSAEWLTNTLWIFILHIILYQFFNVVIVIMMAEILFTLPLSRRRELEADYIGLLLLASAGYDPRVAPKVYQKLADIYGDLPFFFSTHPPGKKRAELLSQAKVMQEALDIYTAVIEEAPERRVVKLGRLK